LIHRFERIRTSEWAFGDATLHLMHPAPQGAPTRPLACSRRCSLCGVRERPAAGEARRARIPPRCVDVKYGAWPAPTHHDAQTEGCPELTKKGPQAPSFHEF